MERTRSSSNLLDRLGTDPASDVVVVYDGECLFCASYVKLLRLREAAGQVALLDARAEGLAEIITRSTGLDLNEGMLAIYGGEVYHGAEAVHILSLLSSEYGLWNRSMAKVLRRQRLARALYPVLRFGRNVTLALRGRSQIFVPQR